MIKQIVKVLKEIQEISGYKVIENTVHSFLRAVDSVYILTGSEPKYVYA